MTDVQKTNKPLFSQHYLDHRIQECSEWQLDVGGKFESLQKLYLSKKDLLPKLSEAQTEAEFIKPVLDILGFSNIPQVTTHGKGRAERPDYALFTSESDRNDAYPLQGNEMAFYARVSAIAEAKYWERALSKASANDQRDIYKNANPSFQITNYLVGTGVDWGILTNGREWRLYYRLASSTATEFYQVDLVELLESRDEDKFEKFKYFWLFFCGDSFVKDPQGRNFLERVREGSNTYATQVGKELKALVFEQVFPSVAGGFAANAFRLQHQVTSEEIYEATLSFLYKLLFLLYAEARNLLPINSDYRDYSLIEMSKEIAQGIGNQKKFSQTGTGLYDRLLSLFQIIDRGDPSLDVPRYNGGLFHFDFNQSDDQVNYPANHFLFRFKLSDAILAPALDKLARFEGLPIDYSFLGVRQLGSIYEGLLEYRVVIDNAEKGEVHLENDKGERKSTGSYYTPDYIVKYIVSHTLKPILEKRSQRFSELMTEISQLNQQLQDKRLGVQSRNGIQKDLQRLGREAQTTLLDIKVCDPSMGSGHFLVESVDYLTDELILILNQYPEHNPILEMLNQTRESILENLAKQGIRISPDRLEPTQLLQRVVMKRCIYGVDLNLMAVELAKVSLWLHSFTVGAPLSFLDHHLRCGNSLIGTTVKEAEASMIQESTGQFNLLAGPFVGLLRAAEIMRGVSILSDATFAELEQSEKLFRQFDQAAKPYKKLLDIYVSKSFGLKRADHFLRVFGTNAIAADVTKMNKADAAVYKNAQKLSEEKHFFHWDLEFPEVFIDLENARWDNNAGFDAVIGNPPYEELSEEERSSVANEIVYFQSAVRFNHALGNRINIYRLFIVQGISILKSNGKHGFIVPLSLLADQFTLSLRKYLLENFELNTIEQFPQKDDRHNRIFFEAKLSTCIYILSKKLPNREHQVYVRTHLGKDILDDSAYYKTLQNDFMKFDSHNLSIPGLDKRSWNLTLRLATDEIFIRLGDFISASPGELMINISFKPYLSDSISGEEAIRGSHIARYAVVEPKQGEAIFFNRDLYLSEHANSKKALAHQQMRVVYQRYAAIDNYRRLIATILPENYFCSHTTGYISEIKDYSLGFISTLLNSTFLDWRFNLTSTNNNVNGYEIESLPVPKINFTTPLDRREQSLQNAIALYHQYQSDRQIEPLLNQVNHHLSQEQEEADVIHDLLAYLAEQMIELNKQKQTEIKSFLKWLERFIGCEIDTLTNKSKIQNYLGDYYKNESSLSFDDLIEVLKKNKKKIKIDPVSRKEQQSLEKEYQDSMNTLLPIKEKLTNCDKLIDAIVYRLYGLTEEEIAIVEGITNTNSRMRQP
ncbi:MULTISPECIES: Eco57I restriction-modification methylase domain-containing protein [Pseudanabaena]|jgi:type I restriction-modification system DNA methylase subunit|uniref:Eco57I restriction-modification methylase domain-containing protein n=1 Tax=Pseudanabaena TaxID=1152 RepID=UPI002479BA13|nr:MULTISPECIES: N-6 DNA methylase [Pseudanabaena]MEA5488399.1 N-6 DNA methylase [Pseudanabaena sp. CCNP1317]WGS70395.1 N-6 DNA methylase [Pseudanabaena galeata CCNP1313]